MVAAYDDYYGAAAAASRMVGERRRDSPGRCSHIAVESGIRSTMMSRAPVGDSDSISAG